VKNTQQRQKGLLQAQPDSGEGRYNGVHPTNHRVTESNKAPTSSALEPVKLWKKVITKNEDYFCAVHAVMKGKFRLNE
jgi:hypothetical protein